MSALREVTAADIRWGVDDTDLPQIETRGQDPVLVSEETIRALQRANNPPVLFRYAGVPSRVEASIDGPQPTIASLDVWRLRYHAQRSARYVRTGKRGAPVLVPAPLDVMRDILAAPEWPFPVLHRIVQAPVFAADGTLCVEPGYHAAGIYYAPAKGLDVRRPPARPSREDVADAVTLVDDVIADFPFADAASRAHAIALFLQPFARDLIAGPTPLYPISKPAPGTGGTLLSDVLVHPALGKPATQIAIGHGDEAEIQKSIAAALRRAPGAISFDNITTLTSPALASILTAYPEWDNRELGRSEMMHLPIRTTWIATANNPVFSADIARRCVPIRLDAGVEHPEERTDFRHSDLRAWIAEHRADLAHAALVIIQSWLASGRPLSERTIGSYETWARVMGGILAHAGIDSFLANYADMRDYSVDAAQAAWRAFVERWFETHGTSTIQGAELWALAGDLDLGTGSERSQRIRLGQLLMRHRDQIVSGYRLVTAGEFRRATLWRLSSVDVNV